MVRALGQGEGQSSDLGRESPRQDGGNRSRAQGTQETNSHVAARLGLVLSSSILSRTFAAFALTFTSSAYLLAALKGSNKQLLEGPQGQQHKSCLPGVPPRGMSTGGAECGERHAEADTASYLRGDGGCALVPGDPSLVSGSLMKELPEARSPGS